jgi:hypothetical protein
MKGRRVPIIDIELVPDFKGEPVILVAMDIGGLSAVQAAISSAQQGLTSTAAAGQVAMKIIAQADRSILELDGMPIVWRLTPETAREIAGKLDALAAHAGPCHHYVDIDAPAKTLVLAKDEYIGA